MKWLKLRTNHNDTQTKVNISSFIRRGGFVYCFEFGGGVVSDWISVSKELPEDSFMVIACVDDDVCQCQFREWDDGFYEFQSCEDGEVIDATHWMPLPDPPQ